MEFSPKELRRILEIFRSHEMTWGTHETIDSQIVSKLRNELGDFL